MDMKFGVTEKKDIMQSKRPRNSKGSPHGLWEVYLPSGELWFRANYINGEQFGYDECYILNKKYYAR